MRHWLGEAKRKREAMRVREEKEERLRENEKGRDLFFRLREEEIL